MKRTKLRRIGKIGHANLTANKRLAQYWMDEGITYCEIKLPGCWKNFYLQNVHRNKRSFYKGNVDLLCNPKQVIRGCPPCHEKIENDKELTEKIFLKLRGKSLLNELE